MCVHGPTGASECWSTPFAKIVFGPVPEDVRHDRPADERREEQEDDEADRRERELVAPEPDPDELPVAPRLDLRPAFDGDCFDRNGVLGLDVDLAAQGRKV